MRQLGLVQELPQITPHVAAMRPVVTAWGAEPFTLAEPDGERQQHEAAS